MKRICSWAFIVLPVLSIACATGASITSPNKLSKVPATLYLENGDSLYGNITLNNEVIFPKDIQITTSAGKQQLHLMEVKSYAVGSDVYELKHTSNRWRPSSGFYFMKRVTPDGAPMHLYRNTERRQKGKSINDIVYLPVYYLQFPGEKQHRVHPISGSELAPHFDKKMSAIVKGCAVLSQKIKGRQNGYYYSQLGATEETRKDIVLRIIDEWAACGANDEKVVRNAMPISK